VTQSTNALHIPLKETVKDKNPHINVFFTAA